jgi:hypothetical protein
MGTPARAHAQHVAVGVGVGFGYPVPAYGYGYYPWAPYYQVGPYPYPYPYPFHYVDPGASVRLEVTPKQAEVYVDGFYAGVVDDYDGTFQRLHIPPGEHDITLYLDGYRTVKQHLRLSSDKTFKVKYQMEKLGAGEQTDPRPTPPAPPPDEGQSQPGQPSTAYPPNEPGVRVGTPRPMPPNVPPPPNVPRTPNAPPPPGASRQAPGYGTIAIRVQPGDADVMIDGEPWHGPADQDRLLVEVPVGRHAIEIRKTGYRTYVTELDVHAGKSTPLNVSLRGQ